MYIYFEQFPLNLKKKMTSWCYMVTSINQIKFYFIDYRKALAYLTIDMYKKKVWLKASVTIGRMCFYGRSTCGFYKKKKYCQTRKCILRFLKLDKCAYFFSDFRHIFYLSIYQIQKIKYVFKTLFISFAQFRQCIHQSSNYSHPFLRLILTFQYLFT